MAKSEKGKNFLVVYEPASRQVQKVFYEAPKDANGNEVPVYCTGENVEIPVRIIADKAYIVADEEGAA
jgi:hypothetical protein